ncbi:MAG: signal peptide peptidase SppA [Rickettsiaceae bacterium]|nr:signal peptide peptidase SppA [Rickettsiaceae bacterium]
MNLSPDYLIERKRNKKQLAKWKLFSLLLLILILIIFVGKNYSSELNVASTPLQGNDYIGRIRVNDIIADDLDVIENLEKIADNKKVKALIVHINSPGGSVVGSEMLYNSISKLSKNIPIAVVMGSVAASGGYMTALAGDYIIAHNGTITGSIGVLMQSAEITELADTIGVKFTNFKSAELKANPSFTEKLTPEAYQATMDSIYEVYDYFIELVAARRNLDIEYVKKLADGRIYSGRQALDLKLIDAIGNEDTARNWLEKEKGIPEKLLVRDIKLKPHEKFIDILLRDFNSTVSNLINSSFNGLKSIM